jgi:hypothetical protein
MYLQTITWLHIIITRLHIIITYNIHTTYNNMLLILINASAHQRH